MPADAVLFVHAFPLDGRMWQPQLAALEGRWRALAPDLPGFGRRAGEAPEVAGMDLLADDLARLLDEQGIGRVVLCGLSLGGYVGFAFARRHAGRLAALVLADTRAGRDSDEAARARLEMAERVLAEGVGFVPEAMLPRLLGDTARRSRPELVEHVTSLVLEQAPRAIAAAQRGMAGRPDSSATLAALGLPALVMAGSEDQLAGPDEGRTMARLLPDARFVVLEGAGHLSNLERPGEFNAALQDFLAAVAI